MRSNAIPLALLAMTLSFAASVQAQAQDRIYRCGNEYTNNEVDAKSRGCKLMQGGNLTIVQTQRPTPVASPTSAQAGGAAPGSASSGSAASGCQAPVRVASADQRARDADARAIFESELRKAESRQAELLREFNNGEPDKRGDEARNYQKYLDRVAELKSSIARNESDIAGIRREIARLPPP